jgi:hypothetical protein
MRAKRLQTAGWAHTAPARPPLPPAAQEVVPHDTTRDSGVDRSDFTALRRRGRFKQLPSTKANHRSGERSNHDERGAQRSASSLRAPSTPVSCGINFGDGGIERAKRLQTAGWAHTLPARPPLPPAAQEVVPHDTTRDSGVDRSDFAALRRRHQPRCPLGTSAPRARALGVWVLSLWVYVRKVRDRHGLQGKNQKRKKG